MAADVTTTGGDGNGRPGLRVQPRYPGTEARAGKFPGPSLIPALTAIQRRVGWLPREELVALSRDVRRPLYEIEGLISFYPHFRTSPPKAVQLAVCHDLTCWLHGSDDRIREAKERYGDDVEIEIVEVSCLGRCDDRAGRGRRRAAAPDWRGGRRRRGRPRRQPGRDSGAAPARASAARTTRTRPPASTTACSDARSPESCAPRRSSQTLKDSQLRGMGGAGFPTGQKWEIVAEPGAAAALHDLQRRRVRARNVQGPPDPRRAAAPRPRGDDARDAGDRLGGGLGLHPPRVRPRGARPRGRDRAAARGAACSATTSSAPAAGCRSRSSPRRAATSSARSRPCWSAWRATAASRATSRRSRASTGCGASRR